MILALKLVLSPLLIAAITVLGERYGPRVAGALTALPVVAGPIALFFSLEQGAGFGARAARATLASELSLGIFCVLYAWMCLRAPWWASLAVGWAGFAAGSMVLHTLDPPLLAALGLALATPALVQALAPRTALPARVAAVGRSELGLRMAAGAVLVLLLTLVAPALGAGWSGLLTIFPIATTVLAVFSHRTQGAPFAVHLLRGLAAGLYSMTAFFLALALGLEPLGVAGAFGLALAAATSVQLGVLAVLQAARLRTAR